MGQNTNGAYVKAMHDVVKRIKPSLNCGVEFLQQYEYQQNDPNCSATKYRAAVRLGWIANHCQRYYLPIPDVDVQGSIPNNKTLKTFHSV